MRKRKRYKKRPVNQPEKFYINGKKRYNQLLEIDKYKEFEKEKSQKREEWRKGIAKESRASINGTSNLSFEDELKDEDNLYLAEEKEQRLKHRKSVITRSAAFSLIALAAAVGFNYLSFHVPFTPSIIRIDFSAFPLLLAGLCVHPAVGAALVLIKSLICYFINPASVSSIPNKALLDIIYIIITCIMLRLILNSKTLKRKNELRVQAGLEEKEYGPLSVLTGGFISSVLTAIISVFTLKFILLPLLYRFFGAEGYNAVSVFNNYKAAFDGMTSFAPFISKIIPSLNSLTEGIIIYNVPLNIFKYFSCAIVASILYLPVYNFIHKK